MAEYKRPLNEVGAPIKRTALGKALVHAFGVQPAKVSPFIGEPECVGFELIGVNVPGYSFDNRPDDDFRIDLDGSPVVDWQRNVTNYSVGDSWTWEGPIKTGSLIEVYVFDGWASGYAGVPWRITFRYSDSSSQTLSGGRAFRGTSPYTVNLPSSEYFATGPHFLNYYKNGNVRVPPALGWAGVDRGA